jgi:hypothetical protein
VTAFYAAFAELEVPVAVESLGFIMGMIGGGKASIAANLAYSIYF